MNFNLCGHCKHSTQDTVFFSMRNGKKEIMTNKEKKQPPEVDLRMIQMLKLADKVCKMSYKYVEENKGDI